MGSGGQVIGVRAASLRDQARDMERIRLRALVPAAVWVMHGVMRMKRPPRRKR